MNWIQPVKKSPILSAERMVEGYQPGQETRVKLLEYVAYECVNFVDDFLAFWLIC